MTEPGSSPPAQNDGGSSPLFFSSSPQRQASSPERGNAEEELADRTGRMQINNMSSPLAYSSSPPPASRNNQSSTALRSDVENNERRRNNARNRRGDIYSSDYGTPQRRRLVDDVTMSGGNNGLDSEGNFSVVDEDIDMEDEEAADNRVLWGTNISVSQSNISFKNFLRQFKPKYRMKLDNEVVLEGEGENHVYMEMLHQMMEFGLTNLNLDMKNLLAFPPTKKLYYQLINYPQDLIPILDMSMMEVLGPMHSQNNKDFDDSAGYRVRPFGIQEQKGMRELNPGDIDKLVAIKGLVIRATPVIPDMKQAFFKCSVCNHTVEVAIDRGTIAEPTKCPRDVCNQTNSMQIVHNRSDFADKQIVRLQETPDFTPDGQTPHSVSLCVYDELVDLCKAGDRVEVTGVFRSSPVRINPRQRTLKSLFKTYIDVVHIQKVDKKRMGVDVSTTAQQPNEDGGDLQAQMNELQQQQQDVETRKISDAEVERIRETAGREDIYELLSRSLAPSVYEQDDVKKGILLQLFGGTNKTFEKGGSPRYRGDINILLCGDPSTSKSQILQYIHKIAPRGIYTSGKGSSAVGLTAYVTRDLETKQLVLESGALVLSDGGVCCIDEFDKMSDSTRSVLHEVMEQQTISIAKAGIITTLNARTSILASANPIGSKYDTNLSVPQNIDLPPPLLSRFDLVYLIIDKIDEVSDRRLATHLASMYAEDRPENASTQEILPTEFLTMYISYAKQHVKPTITPAAKDELVKAYVGMRKMGEDVRTAEKRITATTRQLESMIRLSEAHAKMRLSEHVLASDVKEAVRLIRSAIKDYAMDPITGTIDMDLVQTGTSSAQRRQRADLGQHILGLLDAVADNETSEPGSMRFDELYKRVNDTSEGNIEQRDVESALKELSQEGSVSISAGGAGGRRLVRRVHGV